MPEFSTGLICYLLNNILATVGKTTSNRSQNSVVRRLKFGEIFNNLLQIYCRVSRPKNFENWSAVDEVKAKSIVTLRQKLTRYGRV